MIVGEFKIYFGICYELTGGDMAVMGTTGGCLHTCADPTIDTVR